MFLHVRVVEATDVPKMDIISDSDPYVVIYLSNSANRQRTKTINNTKHPEWNQEFHFPIHQQAQNLHLLLMDQDTFSKDDPISQIEIPVGNLVIGQIIDQWYDLCPMKKVKNGGRIHLVIQVAPKNAKAFHPVPPNMLPSQPMMPMQNPMPMQSMMIPQMQNMNPQMMQPFGMQQQMMPPTGSALPPLIRQSCQPFQNQYNNMQNNRNMNAVDIDNPYANVPPSNPSIPQQPYPGMYQPHPPNMYGQPMGSMYGQNMPMNVPPSMMPPGMMPQMQQNMVHNVAPPQVMHSAPYQPSGMAVGSNNPMFGAVPPRNPHQMYVRPNGSQLPPIF